MRFKTALAALSALVLSCGGAIAQDGRNVIYGALGMADDDVLENDSMPFAIGFLHQRQSSNLVFGFDIAGEGTMLDSTWGGEELRQAVSFNLLLGGNVAQSDRFRLDAAVLVGMRETFADCPDSYLGYQCYADTAPDTEYDVNFGALVGVSFDSVMLGLRATGESTQAVVGFRF